MAEKMLVLKKGVECRAIRPFSDSETEELHLTEDPNGKYEMEGRKYRPVNSLYLEGKYPWHRWGVSFDAYLSASAFREWVECDPKSLSGPFIE